MPHAEIHLFLGPDRAQKLQRIQAMERALGIQPFDRHQLDGISVTAAGLLALCRQQPAASPVRLIVVDQAHRLDDACVEALVEHAGVIAKSACVVLLVETALSVRHALARAGKVISTEQFPGRNHSPITPFALTDALGRSDLVGALAAVHDQLVEGKEPTELLGLVGWQLQRWVAVKRLLATGRSLEEVASVTGLRPWQAERLRSEVAHRSLASLQERLAQCWRLEADVKSGRMVPELAIEQLAIEVCRPGQRAAPSGAGAAGNTEARVTRSTVAGSAAA